MRHPSLLSWLLAIQLAGTAAVLGGQIPPDPRQASAIFLEGLEPPALAELAEEALERDPGVARAQRRAAAAATRAPQVRALPDPVAALTLFVLPPETRVGPQEFSVSVQQKLPWLGKLALREQAALFAAAAAAAEIETRRLDVLTEVRRLAVELAFLDEHEAVLKDERRALERYEEAARARYATGSGLQQEIIRIQTQITRTDQRLLEVAERRASLTAALNTLRDRPVATPVPAIPLPPLEEHLPAAGSLFETAVTSRPELAAAAAEIARRSTLVELAEKNFKPDFTAGLAYTRVGRRDDPAGRAAPPDGNGDDILAFSGAVHLPVWRRKLEAGLQEALAEGAAAEEEKRRLLTEIDGKIGDLATRLPLLYEHWQLLDEVMHVQAQEALRSAETAYTTGKLNAVDLLDAEFVLFDVRTATARTAADHAVARIQLERAMARPLAFLTEDSNHEP